MFLEQLGSDGSGRQRYRLLGCDAVDSGTNLPKSGGVQYCETSVNCYGFTLRHISSKLLCSQISYQKVPLICNLNLHASM